MDTVHKVEYNVRNLATRSVTLFPSHAQVFRDIPKVPLQPGTNEITILGLTPTVDEDSIKVEGSGSAIIADIAVESLPNRDIFEEIYPDSDEDKTSADEESDEEEPDCPAGPELKAAWARRQQLQDQLDEADELVQSAGRRKVALDDYASTLSCEHGIDLEKSIEAYKKTRGGVVQDALAGQKRQREVKELLTKANKEVDRLTKLHRKEKTKASKEWKKSLLAKTKSKIKEARREDERLAEKERVQKERKKFWPKYCYAVKITLEANAFTPSSSRRGSMSSDIEIVNEKGATPGETQGTCDLLLSYVTSSAYWSPSYDLQLSTSGENGTLCFDAQLNNTTSETWDKCKITLSTSQTTSSGLEDVAPALVPWRLKLHKADHPNDTTALMSSEEKNHKAKTKGHQKGTTGKNRNAMFGVDGDGSNDPLQDYQMQLMLLEHQNKKRLMKSRQEQGNNANNLNRAHENVQNEYAVPPPPPPPAPAQTNAPSGGGLFGAPPQAPQPPSGGLFGNNSNRDSGASTGGGGLFGDAPQAPKPQAGGLFGNGSNRGFGAATGTAGGLFGNNIRNDRDEADSRHRARHANGGSSLFGAPAPQAPAAVQASYVPENNGIAMGMSAQQQQPQQQQMQMMQQQQQRPTQSNNLNAFDFDAFLGESEEAVDTANDADEKEALDFQESLVEESGFTTTYEIPGQKTLAPKSNTSKQRIARINFTNVVFSHTIVAKYKPVAHLSAKLQNMSKLTLLRGPVGVTLDGSFMGRTTLPRCGAGGEFIRLSLGVDPAVRVVYAQPEVRRATTGYFSHEEIKIYTRTIRIENTRTSSSKHTKLLVRDQVPVSSVDKLRVELLKPEGLVPEGDKKDAGEAGRDKDKDAWGSAEAKLHKDGEVTWLVALRAGKSVKLGLEYLVGTPIGDHAVQAF